MAKKKKKSTGILGSTLPVQNPLLISRECSRAESPELKNIYPVSRIDSRNKDKNLACTKKKAYSFEL